MIGSCIGILWIDNNYFGVRFFVCFFKKISDVIIVYVGFCWVVIKYYDQFVVFNICGVVVIIIVVGVGYGIGNLCSVVGVILVE